MLNNIEIAKLPLLSVVRQTGEVPEPSDLVGQRNYGRPHVMEGIYFSPTILLLILI